MARKTRKKPKLAPAPVDEHIQRVHEAESLVDKVEEARERLRVTARGAMGVTGATTDPEGLAATIAGSGVGWYPLLALGLLAIVDQFQGYALFVLGPEISRALGISRPALGGLAALKSLAISTAALPMAAFVQRKARRGIVSIATAFLWSTMTTLTGLVTSVWGMLGILIADGVSSGSVQAVHQPLLIDSYPPKVRVRVLSYYQGFERFGSILSPLFVALLTAMLAFTWRGVFLIMGITSVLASWLAIRLRDPGFGKWDAAKVREAVRQDSGFLGELTHQEEDVQLGFFENVRRLFLIPTIRRLLASFAVLGMLLIPLNTYLFFFLEERWGMGPGARGVFLAVMSVFGIGGVAFFGRRGERMFRLDLANLPKVGSWLLAIGIVSLALSLFVPVFGLMVLLQGGAYALFAILNPIVYATLLSIIPPRMRPHAAALSGIFLAGVGGFLGLLLLSGVDRRFGTSGAILSIAIPGVLAAIVLRSAHKTVNADLDRMVDELVEEEEVRGMVSAGEHLPLLACRKLNFSYGSVQVLFDVNFTVDDGEMVGLLGTNGAGKSTLLRAISGLGHPTGGSVRLRGGDITYLDPERRLKLGITQIPGGRAVFGPLSVVENLRLFGFTLGRDRPAIERAIKASLDAFPALEQRRNLPAGTLSGGEQQMLGLARALILRPRLLLIDELSLGLAPMIVSQLLEMVRLINEGGTAVVLVEQSVNVALSLVDHVYFMEKGEIRFDGSAAELLEREDLLRSVFLQGAAKALTL